MSAKVMGQVYDLDLPQNEQSVLLAMADHSDHHGDNVFPSNGLLAWKLGSSEDTIRRLKAKLQKRGILILVAAEPGRPKRYKINLAAGVLKPPFAGTPPAICYPPQFATPSTAMPGHPPQSSATPPPAKLCGGNRSTTTKEPNNKVCQRFIALWCRDYVVAFKCAYQVTPKDAGAVKRFFDLNKDVTPEDLVEVARRAWAAPANFWNCARCKSIAFFVNSLNDVKSELGETKPAAPARKAGPDDAAFD